MSTHDLQKWITSDFDFYSLLGIEIEACTETELRRAYRKTALKYHPDKVGAKFDPEKYEVFQAAYEVLSNPSSKSQYDHFRLAKLQKKRANELFEGKRKQMKDDLEAREKNGILGAEKRFRADETQRSEFSSELRRLAEEGRKKRAERTRMMAENTVTSSKTPSPKRNTASGEHTQESPKYAEKDAEIERLEMRIKEVEELKLKRKAEKKAKLRSRIGGQNRETSMKSSQILRESETNDNFSLLPKSPIRSRVNQKKNDFAITMARLKAAEKARHEKRSIEQDPEAI